jgi:hypothetical protein
VSASEGSDAVAARLEHLHALCGLDWGLVANLTGVSLNAIFFARAGKRMHPRAVERLEALIAVVESSPAATAAERHDWMFQIIDGGRTRIQWFAALGRCNRVPLQGPGYTPAQLLGGNGDKEP